MKVKPGFLTSEFYIALATIISTIGVGIDAISKTNAVSSHPAVAAAVAVLSTAIAGVSSVAYSMSRAFVKAAASRATVLPAGPMDVVAWHLS